MDTDKIAQEASRETFDIGDLRKEYRRGKLHRADLHPDPIAQFRSWFEDARAAQLPEPNAMVLSTCGADGTVTSRTVLLKAFDARGFVFFTNYESRKARQIAENPKVALLFPWFAIERQVAITGRAEKISVAESTAYFLSRPVGSRIGAWVSEQSRVVSSRKILEEKFRSLLKQFAHGEIPKPDWWGGFRVVPDSLEFWQGGTNRIHDRFIYTRSASSETGWEIARLQP
jgi:pyridoxamine 5'-phosphate oxidase